MRNEPYSQGAMSFDCEMQEITILHTMNLNLDYNYKCSDESVSVLCATLQHIKYFHNLMSNNKLNGKKHRQMWNIMDNIKGSWNMGGDNIAEEHQPRWDMDITVNNASRTKPPRKNHSTTKSLATYDYGNNKTFFLSYRPTPNLDTYLACFTCVHSVMEARCLLTAYPTWWQHHRRVDGK